MLLLGKATPRYVQFVFATYFCEQTGHKQLCGLLGKKYFNILEGHTTNFSMLRKITTQEFGHKVSLFNTTADLSIWRNLVTTFDDIAFAQSYIPYLCLVLLYDTSYFRNSSDDEIVQKQEEYKFSSSFKGIKIDSC